MKPIKISEILSPDMLPNEPDPAEEISELILQIGLTCLIGRTREECSRELAPLIAAGLEQAAYSDGVAGHSGLCLTLDGNKMLRLVFRDDYCIETTVNVGSMKNRAKTILRENKYSFTSETQSWERRGARHTYRFVLDEAGDKTITCRRLYRPRKRMTQQARQTNANL